MTPPRKEYPKPVPSTKKAREAYFEREALEKQLAEYHAAKKRELANSPAVIKRRLQQIQSTYKITEDQLLEILKMQGRRCAICQEAFEGWECNVDHDHLTGRVRGLLCRQCNFRIGGWDDPKWARAAAAYLGIIPREKTLVEIDLERKRSDRYGDTTSKNAG